MNQVEVADPEAVAAATSPAVKRGAVRRRRSHVSAALALVFAVAAAPPAHTIGAPAVDDLPGRRSVHGQPLINRVYLPVLSWPSPEDFLPYPAAPLGQAIRDIVWDDDLLYAAMESHVVSFREVDGRLQPVEVSEALPGTVYDLDAASGVVYAAHVSLATESVPAGPGGLTALAGGESGALRALSRVVLDATDGYAALAVVGDTVAALRCAETATGGRIECGAIDAIDTADPARPRFRGSVQIPHDTDKMIPALAVLDGGRVTDGVVVVDVSGSGPPTVIDELEWPLGKPVSNGDDLVTYDRSGEVRLFRTDGLEIVEVDVADYSRFGLQVVTAAAFASGGILLSGPDAPLRPQGRRWVWAPVTPTGFGEPTTGTSTWVDRSLLERGDVLWHAMSSGATDDHAIQPYMPAIVAERLVAGNAPTGELNNLWTGWNWRTHDVLVSGDYAYALASAGGPTIESQGDLLVFDVSEPRVPTLVGWIHNVCTAPPPGGFDPYEECSVGMAGDDRLLVSSKHGAREVSVEDPTHPTLSYRTNALGTQLEPVPGGLLALREEDDHSRQLVRYDTARRWPDELWSVDVGTAYKLAVDVSREPALVALIDGLDYKRIGAGRLAVPESPPLLSYLDEPSGSRWMQPGLLAADGSLIVARSDFWDLERAPDDPVGQPWLGGLLTPRLTARSPPSRRPGRPESPPFSAQNEPVLEAYHLVGDRLELEWSVPLQATDEFGWTIAIVGGQIMVGHQDSLEAFSYRPGRAPTRIGRIPYSDGVLTGWSWSDSSHLPRLVTVGPGYAYVAGHPGGQVLGVPALR